MLGHLMAYARIKLKIASKPSFWPSSALTSLPMLLIK